MAQRVPQDRSGTTARRPRPAPCVAPSTPRRSSSIQPLLAKRCERFFKDGTRDSRFSRAIPGETTSPREVEERSSKTRPRRDAFPSSPPRARSRAPTPPRRRPPPFSDLATPKVHGRRPSIATRARLSWAPVDLRGRRRLRSNPPGDASDRAERDRKVGSSSDESPWDASAPAGAVAQGGVLERSRPFARMCAKDASDESPGTPSVVKGSADALAVTPPSTRMQEPRRIRLRAALSRASPRSRSCPPRPTCGTAFGRARRRRSR